MSSEFCLQLLLQGSVVVRLGVLLLKTENVKCVLGGQVDALLEENGRQAVLSRTL